MSLKPKKFSELKKEQIHLKSKMQKKQKEINYELPRYTYIVSEGTKTEPYYIEAIVKLINEKYRAFSTGKLIVVKGTGRNTKGLLEYARKNVEREFPQAEEVWLMYDKDDFPIDSFDNTQYSAEGRQSGRQYRVAFVPKDNMSHMVMLLHHSDVRQQGSIVWSRNC